MKSLAGTALTLRILGLPRIANGSRNHSGANCAGWRLSMLFTREPFRVGQMHPEL